MVSGTMVGIEKTKNIRIQEVAWISEVETTSNTIRISEGTGGAYIEETLTVMKNSMRVEKLPAGRRQQVVDPRA